MKSKRAGHLFEYSDIVHEDDGTVTIGSVSGVPDITASRVGAPAAWFLGPRAENRAIFAEMVNDAVAEISEFRHSYMPEDEPVVTDAIKSTPEYREAVSDLRSAYRRLLDFLSRYSTPYFSMRYQGHMLWDTTLPAMAAYFATMLHNPNNVSIQGSTATTPLGILVGWDLCQMVGFPVGNGGQDAMSPEPWAHITADGSIANIEASWAIREAKFLPFSVRQLVRDQLDPQVASPLDCDPDREALARFTVTVCDGTEVPLLEASSWQLFNVEMDQALALPERIAEHCGVADEYAVWSAVVPYSLNSAGWESMLQEIRDASVAAGPVLITPSTRHYSWPKTSAVLGYGVKRARYVYVDRDARMDMGEFRAQLDECLTRRIPVSQVVAVTGTTEEGAVDPVCDILDLRAEYRAKGLDFSIHVDAAWGGYMLTALRRDFQLRSDIAGAEAHPDLPPYDARNIFVDDVSQVPISDYVIAQFRRMRECDSVTIDPHKWGYVQYPAGSVLYRNGRVRRLTTFTGAYIGGTGSVRPGEPTVGVFGLEGSKPGAAAAAVFLSHRVIRPSVSGHGKLICESMINTKLLYLQLMYLNVDNDDYEVIPLNPLPPDRDGKRPDFGELKARFAGKSPHDILADRELADYFRRLGPDQNILDYVFNPKDASGEANTGVEEFRAFNEAIYDAFHVHFAPPQPISEAAPFLITKTIFNRDEYGPGFVTGFASAIGLDQPERVTELPCLRSVVMDPYLPYTVSGDFFDRIAAVIDTRVRDLARAHRAGTGSVE